MNDKHKDQLKHVSQEKIKTSIRESTTNDFNYDKMDIQHKRIKEHEDKGYIKVRNKVIIEDSITHAEIASMLNGFGRECHNVEANDGDIELHISHKAKELIPEVFN